MENHISREAAVELLKKYNKDSFHLQHALTVEGVMRWYAKQLGCFTVLTLKCTLRSIASRLLSCCVRVG